MAGKRNSMLVIWGLAISALACTEPETPVVVELTGLATVPIELGTGLTDLGDSGQYRWSIHEAPPGSSVATPPPLLSPTFTPDVRGTYVIDRWTGGELVDLLTHYYVLTIHGMRPEAVATAPEFVTVGGIAMISAIASLSPERRPLIYRWRLLRRPRGSTAVIADPEAVTTSFVADIVGTYAIRLEVTDGELWSIEAPMLEVVAR